MPGSAQGDSGGPPSGNATAVIADRLPAIVLVRLRGTVSGLTFGPGAGPHCTCGPHLPGRALGIGGGRLALVPTLCIMGLVGMGVLTARAVEEAGVVTIRCTRKLMTTMIVAGDES